MPNKSSNAGHKAFRTCVICRKKSAQAALLSFYLLDNEVVIDVRKAVQTRKMYVCHQQDCLALLDKWLARYRRKQRKAVPS